VWVHDQYRSVITVFLIDYLRASVRIDGESHCKQWTTITYIVSIWVFLFIKTVYRIESIINISRCHSSRDGIRSTNNAPCYVGSWTLKPNVSLTCQNPRSSTSHQKNGLVHRWHQPRENTAIKLAHNVRSEYIGSFAIQCNVSACLPILHCNDLCFEGFQMNGLETPWRNVSACLILTVRPGVLVSWIQTCARQGQQDS
jgi:hypothetical protein